MMEITDEKPCPMCSEMEMSASDYIETRVTGVHAYFPSDPESRARMKKWHLNQESPARPLWAYYALALLGLGAVVYSIIFGLIAYLLK